MKRHWLMKSEPSSFSVDDLLRRPRRTEPWDGVRNYQARNLIRDEMKPGDLAFFYHSSCDEPGIAGVMEVASPAYPDPTAFDPRHHHFDPDSSPDSPRWLLVDVRLVRKLGRIITLTELPGPSRAFGSSVAQAQQSPVRDAGEPGALGVYSAVGIEHVQYATYATPTIR